MCGSKCAINMRGVALLSECGTFALLLLISPSRTVLVLIHSEP